MKKHYLLITLILFLFLFIFSGKTTSYNTYGSCSLQYGRAAVTNLNGTCSCMDGYYFKEDILGTTCVSLDSKCVEEFGSLSSYDSFKNTCKCIYGYVLGKNYIGNIQCISEEDACENQFGSNAKSISSGKCSCESGYEFGLNDNGEKECLSCFEKHGLNTEYDYLNKVCVCKSGYVAKDGKCEKKQNSAYFKLLEYNLSKKIVKVKSNYNYKEYEIKYGFGCYSIEDYLDKDIVINMGDDFTVDYGDYLVLQDDDETCSILSIEELSSPLSLSIDYEIILAVSWLYDNGLTKYNNSLEFLPYNTITREQAAKFFTEFYKKIKGNQNIDIKQCNLEDLKSADKSLQDYIKLACGLGIMMGGNGNFDPTGYLKQSQAIVILMRILYGSLDENGDIWYKNYYTIAESLGLLNGLNYNLYGLDSTNITRGDLAKILYRAGMF